MGDAYKRWEVVVQAAVLRTKVAMNRVRNGGALSTCQLPDEELLKQTKLLVNDYIDDRLIRSGLNMKQRIVSSSSAPSLYSIRENNTPHHRKNSTMQTLQCLLDKRNSEDEDTALLDVEDISKVLVCVGEYLELRHCGLYTDVLQQLNVRSVTETNLNGLFTNVAQEMFAGGVTWAKIVSLFAFAGGLTVDCVLAGFPMHVTRVKAWTSDFVQAQLHGWIREKGGWIGMFDHFMGRDETKERSSSNHYYWTISALVLVICVLVTGIFTVYFRRTST